MSTQVSLRASRVNANMTLQEASKAIGISEKTLRSWENGNTLIPAQMFNKLCEVYDIDKNLVKIPIVEDESLEE